MLVVAILLCASIQLAHPVLANDAAPTPTHAAQPGRVSSLLGVEVRRADRTIGRIIDLLVRPDGTVEAAVIEYGGFLGIGYRKVAIRWRDLRIQREGQQLVASTDLTNAQLASKPEYKPWRSQSLLQSY